jgi:glutamine---fructose-6-phosphate transaminase (isomerizing)
MSQEATVSYPTCAGRERAIPATKSFTTQLLVLHLLALLAAEVRGRLTTDEVRGFLHELEAVPALIEKRLPRWESEVRVIATDYPATNSFLFLGRDLHYPIAREGALKLKESSYLHAEGYPSGELKHGPNALVSEGTPLVMLATANRQNAAAMQRYERILNLLRDLRKQGARVLCIANDGDRDVEALADQVIFVPDAEETCLPLLEVVPLQLFSYFMAIQAGIDVDKPRNLVKAVVTE